MSHCRSCDAYARRVTQLESEVKESQEDRNFVKSLWRQVQTEHVDIGQIVNTVLNRIAEQNEEKDRSVLEMLQEKDNHIAHLTDQVSWLNGSLDHEREEKEKMKREWEEKQGDLNELISQLEEQIAVKNLQISDPVHQEREAVVERLDKKKSTLEKQLQDMRNDLKSCVAQMDNLKKRHEDQVRENDQLQIQLESRRQELETQKHLISELKNNAQEKREDTALLREKLQIATNDATAALKALEKSERALRGAQQDKLELEEDCHAKEEEHNTAMSKLHKTIAKLEDRVSDLVHEEKRVREEYVRMKNAECPDCKELEGVLETKERELAEKETAGRIISTVKGKCSEYLNRPLALQDIPDVVDMILADVAGTSADMDRSSKLIRQMQINCQEKNVAMAKLQEVHDNRLQRMGTLQEYLSEVLDELKSLDKDRWKELSCGFKDVPHDPQPLRHEDSSTVWADLQHYKTMCSKLKRELSGVQEQLERLQLQRAMDVDTFNAMRAAVMEDQQECERKLRIANHNSICGCNLQLEIHRDKIKELAERTEQLNSENIKLLATLQLEQAKVSKLEGCVCDMEEAGTQTTDIITYSVSTATDNIKKTAAAENTTFQNTLSLLNKLNLENEENLPPPVIKHTPFKHKSDKRRKVACTKTVGIQTVSKPPVKVLQKAPAALKIRMASLNQQVAVLTKAKHRHARDLSTEEAKVDRLETQLSTALRQLSSSQNLVAGLNEDIRIANEEAQTLRDQMHEIERSGLRQSEMNIMQEKTTEIRKINHQNNLLNSQISNMKSKLSDVEKELEEKKLTIVKLEERMSRDSNTVRQQRGDNDHLRQELGKVKSTREELQGKIDELSKRLKRTQEVSENRKNYIETVKAQLSNAKIGIKQANAQNAELKNTLEVKAREVRSMGRKLEGQEKLVSEFQVLASRQLEDQGKQFCALEISLNKKITVLNKRNLEWEKCIRQAIGKIVQKIKQEKDKRVVASSLSSHEYSRAKVLSSSLLQLSEADFHDIMSSTKVNNSENSSKSDSMAEVWKGQLAKILGLDDFGPVLANSLFQLFEEYAKVLSGDFSTQTSNSVLSGNSLTHSSSEQDVSHTPVRLR